MRVVEIVAISAGYGCLISVHEDKRKDIFKDVYTANIIKRNTVGGQSWKKTKVDYVGIVYCVTVPSGKLLVKRNRATMVCGNSGDPIKIICGLDWFESDGDLGSKDYNNAWGKDAILYEGKFYEFTQDECIVLGKEIPEHVVKGSIELLWETFGGTITKESYKLLDEHIGLIYGDSITLQRAEEILKRLEAKGFVSGNVVFGIGSMSYNLLTRDSLGFAMKATYCVVNDVGIELYKDPKTDDGTKKSARGLLCVKLIDGKYVLKDQSTEEEIEKEDCMLRVFKDGVLYNETTLEDIRGRING